jgi:membrane-bound lytic murein transglycosylase MltF
MLSMLRQRAPRRSAARERLLTWLLVWSVSLAVVPARASAPGLARRPGITPNPREERFDAAFRKYCKRYFGPAYDWREFKAQGLTESNLDTTARSHVGARGVMQLMPTTFHEVASRNPDIQHLIDDPEWNIAAGISYDRRLWLQWELDSVSDHRRSFMFASYNAGRGTLLMAQRMARAESLDHRAWPSIEKVAPSMRRWRYRETLEYLRRIDRHLESMDEQGRVRSKPATTTPRRP